jgi:hypothetical protein
MMRSDTLGFGRAPAIACDDLAGCFADRPVVFAEARDDQLGRRALQLDLPAVAVDRLDGDATSEDAELCIGLAGSRVVAFRSVAHGHALPVGAPALPASRAPMSPPSALLRPDRPRNMHAVMTSMVGIACIRL